MPPSSSYLQDASDEKTLTRTRVPIDVSSILSPLSRLHQDDLITFEVVDLGDGHFQAIAVHDIDGLTGTDVQGASNGWRLVSQNGRRCTRECDDDPNNGSATDTPTPTPTSAATA